jgi:hypothetical protein
MGSKSIPDDITERWPSHIKSDDIALVASGIDAPTLDGKELVVTDGRIPDEERTQSDGTASEASDEITSVTSESSEIFEPYEIAQASVNSVALSAPNGKAPSTADKKSSPSLFGKSLPTPERMQYRYSKTTYGPTLSSSNPQRTADLLLAADKEK